LCFSTISALEVRMCVGAAVPFGPLGREVDVYELSVGTEKRSGRRPVCGDTKGLVLTGRFA